MNEAKRKQTTINKPNIKRYERSKKRTDTKVRHDVATALLDLSLIPQSPTEDNTVSETSSSQMNCTDDANRKNENETRRNSTENETEMTSTEDGEIVEDYEADVGRLKVELKSAQDDLEKANSKLKKTERLLEKSFAYVEVLRNEIKELGQKVHDYRKVARNRTDAAVQATEADIAEAQGEKPLPSWDVSVSAADIEAPPQDSGSRYTSIAESLKAAAEATVLEQSGYVYDASTGLYYDYTSGYYYDSAKSLFYDPSTGIYTHYDVDTNEYKFHSQVDISQSCDQSKSAGKDSGSHGNKKHGTSDHRMNHKRKLKEKEKHRKRKKRRRKSVENEQMDPEPSVAIIDENCINEKSEVTNQTEVSNGSYAKRCKVETDEEGNECILLSDDDEISPEIKPENINVSDIDSDAEASDTVSEMESGELTSESEGSDHNGELSGTESEPGPETMETVLSEQEEIAALWPPCVRVIVQESDCLNIGSLFIITCTGATIGREKGLNHTIRIPELCVSKTHASVHYDETTKQYTITDQGSQNGTFVNNNRLSEPSVVSEACPVSHGDVLTLGSTSLLLHIHPGTDTCDECEPGQVQALIKAQLESKKEIVVLSREEKRRLQVKQLKQIKKKYGLKNAAYERNPAAMGNANYTDKADERRKAVGSDNPYVPDEAPASVNVPIAAENVGRKMLRKMGWSEGEGLGLASAGIHEPVSVDVRSNASAGLGSRNSYKQSLDNVHHVTKSRRWIQAQERYQKVIAADAESSVTVTSEADTGQEPVDKAKIIGPQWVKSETLQFAESEEQS